jgi:hypothetical protein
VYRRSATCCAFCHVQIDGVVYRAGKAKLHLVCRPLYLAREPEPRQRFPGIFRLSFFSGQPGLNLRAA